MSKQKVLIIGASNRADRYSFKVLKMLQDNGHQCFPVHPEHKEIEGIKCFKDIKSVKQSGELIDTVSIYVNPSLSQGMAKDLINLKPKRIIFNPGSENPELKEVLQKNGIQILEACTLVLLSTNQFDL